MYTNENERMASIIEWMLEEWPLQPNVAAMLDQGKRARLLRGVASEPDLERDRR
jgi:hypothetical protein